MKHIPIFEMVLSILSGLQKILSREEYRKVLDSISENGHIDERTLETLKEKVEKRGQ